MKKILNEALTHIILFVGFFLLAYTLLCVGKYSIIDTYSDHLTYVPAFYEILHTISPVFIIISSFFSIIAIRLIILTKEIKNALLNQSSTIAIISENNEKNLERFQTFANLLPEGLYETDINGNITFASNKLLELFEYNSELEVLGKNSISFFSDSDIEKAEKNYQLRLKQSLIGPREYKLKTKNGKEINVILQSSLRYNAEGSVIGTRGAILDITEIEKIKYDYKRNYEMLELLINTLPIPLFLQNMKGEIINCNDGFCKLVSLSENEIKNKTVFDIFSKEVASTFYKKSIELMRSIANNQQFTVKCKGRDIVINRSKFIDSNEKYSGKIINIIQDLSLINDVRAQLNLSEETFKVLTEDSVVGIMIISGDDIVYTNNYLCKILGYNKSEIMLNDEFLKNIIYKKDFDKILKMQNVINNDSQDQIRGKLRIISKSGAMKILEINLKKIKYEDNESKLVTVIDITSFYKTQENRANLEEI